MKGISLHIGVNVAVGYPLPELKWAEDDARAMREIARASGYTSRTLLAGKKATSTKVYSKIRRAAGALVNGDAFLLTFAGHGFRIPDQSGDEETGMDSVWCLSDKPLEDDKVYDLLTGFKPGVRVLVVADACNSGTGISDIIHVVDNLLPLDEYGRRKIHEERVREPHRLIDRIPGARIALHWLLPTVVAKALPRVRSVRYLQVDTPPFVAETKTEVITPKEPAPTKVNVHWQATPKGRKPVEASVILLAASRDDEEAAEDAGHGLFTARLLQVWDNGNFKGDLLDFFAAIKQQMPSGQKPNVFAIGKQDPSFATGAPFSI